MVHVRKLYVCFVEAVANGMLRETGAMLDAIEAFLFDRRDQSAVFDNCRRGVAVVGVDSENVHRDSIR